MIRFRNFVHVRPSIRRAPFTTATVLLSNLLAVTSLADPPTLAETLADACSSCHGIDGRARSPIPVLAGIERSRFVTMMKAYRDNSVDNTIMHRFARSYSDAEFEALADFYSAKSPK
jgi:cytochrome subunit of sulfide dehydrogenase